MSPLLGTKETERKRLVKTLCGVTCPAFGSGHLRKRVDEAASAKNSNESKYRKRSAMATTTLVFRIKHSGTINEEAVFGQPSS